MKPQFNLIKNDHVEEKRIFPRFPFSYLTFKADTLSERVFEVKDISHTGMQLSLKDGKHDFSRGVKIAGELRWKGAKQRVTGDVKWETDGRIGIKFEESKGLSEDIKKFLSWENILAGMKDLHQNSLGFEIPINLKVWLRSDGPVELFVWAHTDGEISRFQTILFSYFVEWEDGKGLRSGILKTKRDLETPLLSEDEFIFEMDDQVDLEKVNTTLEFLSHIENRVPKTTLDFLRLKLKG